VEPRSEAPGRPGGPAVVTRAQPSRALHDARPSARSQVQARGLPPTHAGPACRGVPARARPLADCGRAEGQVSPPAPNRPSESARTCGVGGTWQAGADWTRNPSRREPSSSWCRCARPPGPPPSAPFPRGPCRHPSPGRASRSIPHLHQRAAADGLLPGRPRWQRAACHGAGWVGRCARVSKHAQGLGEGAS
jgi:hypothetical protein